MITRRWFSRMMPAAAAAPAILRAVPPNQVAEKIAMDTGRSIGLAGQIGAQIMKPAGLDAFYTAQNVVHQSQRYMSEIREMQRYGKLDANIDALRSVSLQHKMRMQLDQAIMREKLHQSFWEKLQDTFGVRDYFKKLHVDGPQVAEEQGRGRY